jgi:hypothetical protein
MNTNARLTRRQEFATRRSDRGVPMRTEYHNAYAAAKQAGSR